MRSRARISLLGLLTASIVTLIAATAPAAQAAFGVKEWFAATCNASHVNCKKAPPAEEVEKAEEEGYAKAGGHPDFGITDFRVNTNGAGEPEGAPVTHIRVDVAPGLSTDPQAVPQCPPEAF